MARETSYFVQAFNAGRGGSLKADAPIACKAETDALRTAERPALSKVGVVAVSSTGDPETVTMTTSRPSSSARVSCHRPSTEARSRIANWDIKTHNAARPNNAWRRCVRSGHCNPPVAICLHRPCRGSSSRPLISNSGWM
jgi:hypothetical protein